MTLRVNMSASFKGGVVFCSLKWSLRTNHDVNKKLSLGSTRKLFTCHWILSKLFYPFDPRLKNKGHKQDDVRDPSILQSLALGYYLQELSLSRRGVFLCGCVLTHSVCLTFVTQRALLTLQLSLLFCKCTKFCNLITLSDSPAISLASAVVPISRQLFFLFDVFSLWQPPPALSSIPILLKVPFFKGFKTSITGFLQS